MNFHVGSMVILDDISGIGTSDFCFELSGNLGELSCWISHRPTVLRVLALTHSSWYTTESTLDSSSAPAADFPIWLWKDLQCQVQEATGVDKAAQRLLYQGWAKKKTSACGSSPLQWAKCVVSKDWKKIKIWRFGKLVELRLQERFCLRLRHWTALAPIPSAKITSWRWWWPTLPLNTR